MKQTEILSHATHVNGWFPAVYMSCTTQNFRLFHVSNLSVRNFRIFLLMYTGSWSAQVWQLQTTHGRLRCRSCRRRSGSRSGSSPCPQSDPTVGRRSRQLTTDRFGDTEDGSYGDSRCCRCPDLSGEGRSGRPGSRLSWSEGSDQSATDRPPPAE